MVWDWFSFVMGLFTGITVFTGIFILSYYLLTIKVSDRIINVIEEAIYEDEEVDG